ncbi:hypothetical protein RUM44_003394 [Polyplax serrata]|uniref:BZIP domain-containing protein n=1 Tax=Polyplax serrata TaxID=468196 RepID=A0ABR1AGW1_POLSC
MSGESQSRKKRRKRHEVQMREMLTLSVEQKNLREDEQGKKNFLLPSALSGTRKKKNRDQSVRKRNRERERERERTKVKRNEKTKGMEPKQRIEKKLR